MNEVFSQLPEDSPVDQNLVRPELKDGMLGSSLNRVVGLNREGDYPSTEKVYKSFEELHATPSTAENIVEMTAEQKDIRDEVVELVPAFLKEFGLDVPVRTNTGRINAYDLSHFTDEARMREKKTHAKHSTSSQSIYFNGDVIESLGNIGFAKVLTHELVHQHAFESMVVLKNSAYKDGDNKTKRRSIMRRSGLVFYKDVNKGMDTEELPLLHDYFAEYNEAVTEMLARGFIARFLDNISHIESDKEAIMNELRKVYQEKKKVEPGKNILVRDAETNLTVGDDNPDFEITGISKNAAYDAEIHRLEKIIHTVYNAKKDTYGWRDTLDVFKLFTKAYFSGQILQLARILKEVYPNDTFSEVGKATMMHGKKDSM